jgi:plasmid stabilization system protein ParE
VPRRRLKLHPDAVEDIAAGRDWYAQHSIVAAQRFLDEIDAALDLIREAPERWPTYRLGMRRCVISAYPYGIIYRVVSRVIEIYAVAHAKRRPTYWRRRRFR